jgi:hypothetical protein
MPKKRTGLTKSPKRTFRIFCEGEKTEPFYIEEYIENFKNNQRAAVVKIQATHKNTPVQLVEEAIKLKKSSSYLPGDEVWVVYDRESVSKYSHDLHARAWHKASNAGVKVAISNVCFEYWILLHFVETSAAYTCCDDFLNRSALNTSVIAITGLPYRKSDRSLNAKLMDCVPTARQRALRTNQAVKTTHQSGALPYEINPFTDMPKLLQAIDDFQ